MKRILTVTTEQKHKLFDLLSELKFVKRKIKDKSVFELEKIILIFPETISIHHILSTMKQLNEQKLLSSEEFMLKLNIIQVDNKYYYNI